jgi:hypothetical protein
MHTHRRIKLNETSDAVVRHFGHKPASVLSSD